MQTSLLVGSEKQVQSNAYTQLAKRCESGSSGAESAWHTQGHSLCTEVSDEELLIPTDTPQQTNTGWKPPAQPNLALSLLSSPESNILSLPHEHLLELPFCSSQRTFTEYWTLKLTVFYFSIEVNRGIHIQKSRLQKNIIFFPVTHTPSTSWLQQTFHVRFLTIKNILAFALPLATFRFRLTPILHTSHVSFLLLCIIHFPNKHDRMLVLLQQLSASPFFLFSCSLTRSILPQAWTCLSADILLDPLKRILVKPFGLRDLFKSLCRVRDSPEGIHAVEPHAATGTSCASIGPPAPSPPKGPSSQHVLPNTGLLCAASVTILKKCLSLGHWKQLESLQRLVSTGWAEI